METVIDAKNRSLGRVATEAANVLRGKTSATYSPNIMPKIKVKVVNISQAKTTGKKYEQKKYMRHTGYPGGIKYTSLKKITAENPKAGFKKIIRGMIPNNKLRKEILKNLIVEL